MATFRRFEEIRAWQYAKDLTETIYKVSSCGIFSRDYGLRDQMRRAGVSIMSNIAEGFERSGTSEFLQFLAIAKGSSGELRSQLYIAASQGYIDKMTFDHLFELASKISSSIVYLMQYLKNSNLSGTKFKTPDVKHETLKPETKV